MKNVYALLVFFFSLTQALRAQTELIEFKGGEIPVLENTDKAQKIFENLGELQDSKAFYLRFEKGLTKASLTELEKLGLNFEGYVPYNTYLFSTSGSLPITKLSALHLRQIGAIPARAKLSRSFYRLESVPGYTRSTQEGYVKARVYSYRSTHQAAFIRALQAEGYDINEVRAEAIEIELLFTDLTDLAALPYVKLVQPLQAPDVADDREGRSLHRSSAINGKLSGDRKYDGSGIGVAIADDGNVSHIDFTGRITDLASPGGGTHGDMTAGICVGAGNVDERATGHATGADLILYDIGGYPHVVNSLAYFNQRGTFVTSTSYSQGSGGVYTTDTRDIDSWSRIEPRLLHVFSAGNAGTSNGGSGYPQRWGNITGGYKAGKNVIASGNLNDRDILETSSSRGPAEDGRIKPDLCANGASQNSTGPNNTYRLGGGTSAAAPSIAGVVVQLYHAYNVLSGGDTAEAALIKGALQNTAEDLGRPGPDFEHGWGRINGLRAARTLENDWYESGISTTGNKDTFEITVPAGTAQLRVMLHWTDFEGSPTAARSLVNDLDLVVVDSAGTVHQPLVLDASPNVASLTQNAAPGRDSINNSEQVLILSPAAGKVKLIVEGNNVAIGPQKYYVLYYFDAEGVELTWPNGGEGLVPGFPEVIRWDAIGNTGTFTLQHSSDSGKTFFNIGVAAANLRHFEWSPPTTNPGGNNLIRIERSGMSDTSDQTFALLGRASSLSVDTVCPSEISLSWNAVNGADSYIIYRLGQKFMDPIATSSTPTAKVSGVNPFN